MPQVWRYVYDIADLDINETIFFLAVGGQAGNRLGREELWLPAYLETG